MGYDVMRTEHDHKHVDAVEDVDEFAEGGQVEDIHIDISEEKYW